MNETHPLNLTINYTHLEYQTNYSVNGHSKTDTEGFYLEFAVYPLRYQLVIRRLIYLSHLLHRDSSELISKVQSTEAQRNKGDWFLTVQEERIK